MKKMLLMIALVILLAPIAVWAMYKPVRVLAPEWVKGISCIGNKICIEDTLQYSKASELYESAQYFVAGAVGAFQEKPRVIFCITELCYQSFGFNKSSASAVGNSGIVVSPRGWNDYYLRHEMIHHRQSEELGVFGMLLKPEWLVEGMAYSLSHDPRNTLSERWQQSRTKFDAWQTEVGTENLWEEARKL